MEICEAYFKLPESDRPKFLLKHTNDISKYMPQYLASLDKKYYYYMVTFTIEDEHDPIHETIEDYIKQQFTNRPALGVVEAHMSTELTKRNIHHWHVSVKTTKHLAKDRFQYYEKLYGKIDISKNHSQNLNDSLNYIAKKDSKLTRLC